ncbi:MAG: alpha/beta hydrolase [Myxococcota bacterium]
MSLDHVVLEGTGRPRVVVLGVPSWTQTALPFVEALAAGHPTLAIASMQSDPPEPSWAELCAQVERLVTSFSTEPVDLVGLSFGGALALQCLVRDVLPVRSAVLAVTAARFRARERGLIATLQSIVCSELPARGLVDGLLPMLLSPDFLHRPGYMGVLRAQLEGDLGSARLVWGQRLALLATHDVRRSLGELHRVDRVITAEQDWLFPPSESKLLADGLPNAELRTVPGGHAVWLESRDAFVELVHEAWKHAA